MADPNDTTPEVKQSDMEEAYQDLTQDRGEWDTYTADTKIISLQVFLRGTGKSKLY